jgi:2-iminobutanoate/2-iminopropanoate deaminase
LMMETIFTPDAVAPHGHYSQAVKAGSFLFVSGILGNDALHPAGEAPTVGTQARRCLEQIGAIVAAAGGDRACIAKVSIFVADPGLWPDVNQAYADYFGEHRPARIVVPCGALRFGSGVEMDAIAWLGAAAEAEAG